MLRRLIAVTALAVGMSVAAAMTLATPALAKGPSQARITGPGLVRAIVVSGAGEPGQQGRLASLAEQTGLFAVMFGAGADVGGPDPAGLRTSPPKASLGPGYLVVYTVPGVIPRPGQQVGQVRQNVYPRAAGGPVIYTPPGQPGFGQQLQVTGWLRASSRLTRTLVQLGVPLRPGTHTAPQAHLPPSTHPAAAQQAGSRTLAWLIASAAAIAAAAIAGTALWLRHRQPRGARDYQPKTSGPPARSS